MGGQHQPVFATHLRPLAAGLFDGLPVSAQRGSQLGTRRPGQAQVEIEQRPAECLLAATGQQLDDRRDLLRVVLARQGGGQLLDRHLARVSGGQQVAPVALNLAALEQRADQIGAARQAGG